MTEFRVFVVTPFSKFYLKEREDCFGPVEVEGHLDDPSCATEWNTEEEARQVARDFAWHVPIYGLEQHGEIELLEGLYKPCEGFEGQDLLLTLGFSKERVTVFGAGR